jgi:hypothetical protein
MICKMRSSLSFEKDFSHNLRIPRRFFNLFHEQYSCFFLLQFLMIKLTLSQLTSFLLKPTLIWYFGLHFIFNNPCTWPSVYSKLIIKIRIIICWLIPWIISISFNKWMWFKIRLSSYLYIFFNYFNLRKRNWFIFLLILSYLFRFRQFLSFFKSPFQSECKWSLLEHITHVLVISFLVQIVNRNLASLVAFLSCFVNKLIYLVFHK